MTSIPRPTKSKCPKVTKKKANTGGAKPKPTKMNKGPPNETRAERRRRIRREIAEGPTANLSSAQITEQLIASGHMGHTEKAKAEARAAVNKANQKYYEIYGGTSDQAKTNTTQPTKARPTKRKCPACASWSVPGATKRGLDGDMWVSNMMTNGVYRWQRVPSKAKPKPSKAKKQMLRATK